MKSAGTISISIALRSTVVAIFGLVLMFMTSPLLSALTLACLPFLLVSFRIFSKLNMKYTAEMLTASAQAATVAEESFGSIRTVRLYPSPRGASLSSKGRNWPDLGSSHLGAALHKKMHFPGAPSLAFSSGAYSIWMASGRYCVFSTCVLHLPACHGGHLRDGAHAGAFICKGDSVNREVQWRARAGLAVGSQVGSRVRLLLWFQLHHRHWLHRHSAVVWSSPGRTALNTYNSFEHLCCFCCALASIFTRLFQPDGATCIAAPCQLFTYNTERWIYGVAVQVVDGKLSAGQLSSFVIYALYVGTNVGALAGVISNLIQASSSNFRPAYFTLCLLFGRFWFCDK